MKELLVLRVNGDTHETAVPTHFTLLEALRYVLGLTGSKQGCDKGDCGACTVWLNGRPILSCITPVFEAEGQEVRTVEGLAGLRTPPAVPHPLQDAFDLCGAAQCGFRTPGILMSAAALLETHTTPTRVEIDAETGFGEVKKIWIAHDCGRALNPTIVEGQMEGSAYMGFGEALMEAQIFKDADHGRAGLHNAPSLLDYRIPTAVDTPELQSLIVDSIDPEGPYGAKEAGEGPLHPSIPAIANAIHDAVGVRMDALPFSPPRVWRALQEKAALGEAAERIAAD